MKAKRVGAAARRAGERGAALVTSLLVSMLMLAAGGALLLTTGLTAANAIDATSEAQAYYAAEAGLHSALSVVRGNVAPRVGLNLPVGAKVKNDLRMINFLASSNLPGDAATAAGTARLSGWLPYNGTALNSRVPVSVDAGNNLFYQVAVSDPDDPARAKLNDATLVPPYMPRRLILTATGFGPKGSVKQMQMLLRPPLGLEVPGAVTLRGKTGGGSGNLFFDLGTSNGRTFLNGGSGKPVFVTTNGGDEGTVTTWIDGDDKSKTAFSTPHTGNTAGGTAVLPEFLSSPATTEQFIQDMKALDTPDDNITVVEGDCDVPNGTGILLCTGEVRAGGGSDFRGIVLALGGGSLLWKGDGSITGAIFVVKYDRATLTDYDAPSLHLKGAGKSNITYSQTGIDEQLGQFPIRIMGMVEN